MKLEKEGGQTKKDEEETVVELERKQEIGHEKEGSTMNDDGVKRELKTGDERERGSQIEQAR